MSKDDESAAGFMKIAYYLAKHELPESHFPAVIELLKSFGIEIHRPFAIGHSANSNVNKTE